MRRTYCAAEIKVITLDNKDILTSSGNSGEWDLNKSGFLPE